MMRERLRARGRETCPRERTRRYAIVASDRFAASRALSVLRRHSPFSLYDYTIMSSLKLFRTAANTLRARLSPSLRTRGGGSGCWTSPGHEERPKVFAFNKTVTIETWAHQKALERLELEESQRAESD